jgi:hypothetical protein
MSLPGGPAEVGEPFLAGPRHVRAPVRSRLAALRLGHARLVKPAAKPLSPAEHRSLLSGSNRRYAAPRGATTVKLPYG